MSNYISKFRIIGRYVRALPFSIWFNFKYLPAKQAVRLPILLYKPKLIVCKGKIELLDKKSKFGSIMLGFPCSSLYPNSGITLKIRGTIVFDGKASIPNASSIEVGEYGFLKFGEDFVATAQLRIGCHDKIIFGKKVLVSWDNLFYDTDYHATIVNGEKSISHAPIIIGNYSWFGARCTILKGSQTPVFSIIGCNSLINSNLLNRGG